MPKGSRRSVAAAVVAVAVLAGWMTSGSMSGAAPTRPVGPRPTTTTSTATDSRSVDLARPTFTNPTSITNPLFPKSTLAQVVQLGHEGGDTLRFEATQLRDPKVVEWNGRRIRTRVTHFVAYKNDRIIEVARDYYAQADDGSVWYFGEQVDNYEDGVIVNHDGTWLAGRDGPPGMIMPANPRVGDVYRPENIPGLVFEEATVKSTGITVTGPRGPVQGAILIEARLMDGTVEEKVYAPGYGEFQARVASLDELYTLAVAVAVDAGQGAAPAVLRSQLADRLGALDQTAQAGDPSGVRQAAIGVGHASLDLQLTYQDLPRVDRARLELWRDQLKLDKAAGGDAAVAGDIATIEAIRQRIDD